MRAFALVAVILAACSSKPDKAAPPVADKTPSASPATTPTSPTPAAPAPATGGAGIAGTWVTDGGATKLVLEPGGSFVMDTRKGQHVTGTYVLDGTRLTMTGGGEGAISGTFSGSFKGSTIELQFGPKTSTFERQP